MNHCNQNQELVSMIRNQTNTRIYDRNIPSQLLQPYLDVRPVMTKYSYLPIVDPRKQVNTRFEQLPTYNSTAIFNPGNTKSPWSGFASGVNVESDLRNQVFALQKCSQATYVPSSKSDLYQIHLNPVVQQAHSLLFQKDHFETFNPNPDSKVVGTGIFHNSTRCQVKEIGQNECSKV
jgi:hypothetical protein